MVVRLGPGLRDGLDVHVMGAREQVHRKWLRGGLCTVTARLSLGTARDLLGISPAEVVGDVVPLDALWGTAGARVLRGRLLEAGPAQRASAVLAEAVRDRFARVSRDRARERWVEHAASRLDTANVRTVASELQMSERHFRRLFRDAVGLSPKTFARLGRFRRAMSAAAATSSTAWARLAAEAGYYDQAHLIAECRAIAGATPAAFAQELRESLRFGGD